MDTFGIHPWLQPCHGTRRCPKCPWKHKEQEVTKPGGRRCKLKWNQIHCFGPQVLSILLWICTWSRDTESRNTIDFRWRVSNIANATLLLVHDDNFDDDDGIIFTVMTVCRLNDSAQHKTRQTPRHAYLVEGRSTSASKKVLHTHDLSQNN